MTIDPTQVCIEVGAGDGALTGRLADRCGHLVAYEVDENMAHKLRRRVAGRPNVDVVVGDFLDTRLPDVAFHVAGNVPFGITSAIVDRCLHAPTMKTATFITQLEYAKKRTGAYGRWSLVAIRSWPEISWELRGRIARTQFRPVPRVDAGILHLRRRETPLVPPAGMRAYERMVEQGFTGVGGTLRASLSKIYPSARVNAAFRAAEVDRDVVVAFVTPQQWLALFGALELGGRRGPR